MKDLIKRLQRLVDGLASGKYTVFAKSCSIPISTFKTYLDGQSSPKAEHLVKIYAHYGINLNWLLTGEGHHRLWGDLGEGTMEECFSPEDYVLLPLLESRVSAGPEGEIVYEDVADYYPFKRLWLEKLLGKSPENFKLLFLLRVRGDSMSPTINAGEMILVNASENERLTFIDGNIYAVFLPDYSVAIKRLYLRWEEDHLHMRYISDNPNNPPFEVIVPPGKTPKNYVMGRVRWAGKEFI